MVGNNDLASFSGWGQNDPRSRCWSTTEGLAASMDHESSLLLRRRDMTVVRLTVSAGCFAALALVGCGGSPEPPPTRGEPVAAAAAPSDDAPASGTVTLPTGYP